MASKPGLWDVVPFALMVMVECGEVGITTLSKAAMMKGMSHFVFVVYYNAIGTLILLPSFLFRRNKRPPLTFSILRRFFLLGLIGICLRQICAFSGISLSSPTLASALGNLIPAFTFVLAVIFRMEKVDLSRKSSRARVLGTIASVGGAFVVTLYKGPPIMMINKTPSAASDQLLNLNYFSEPSSFNWILGGFLIALTCVFSALWNILQTATVKEYKDETTIVFFYCLFGTIQCAVVSLFAERDIRTWIIRPDIELIAILYSAIVGGVLASGVLTWCLRMRGPIYVAMYKPLGIVIAVVMGVIFLGDVLHIGSVIGAVIIVLGFYAVMWGQAKEEKMVDSEDRVKNSDGEIDQRWVESESGFEEEYVRSSAICQDGDGRVLGCGADHTQQSSHVERDELLCVCCLLQRRRHPNPLPHFLPPLSQDSEKLSWRDRSEMGWNLNQDLKKSMRGVAPYAGMVMVECLDVGLTTLSKAAMSRGMSHFVFVVYSNAIATLILFPASFLLFPLSNRPPLTFSLLCRFFLLGLAGISLMQNCVFAGINFSSPTLGSAMSNLIPAFTFILAVISRVEKVDLRSSGSQLRIMGSIVSISGALIVTLYKGPSIGIKPSIHPSQTPTSSSSNALTASNWILGALFLLAASLSASIWNTLQAATLKRYPTEMIIVSFNSFFGSIQCALIASILERDPTAWSLKPGLELLAIFYSAVIGSVMTPCVMTWCIHEKGPVFVAMFKPLGIAIAALMGAMFLGDTLHLGSMVGAIIIVVGFYGVIWGQSKDERRIKEDDGVENLTLPIEKAPLLQNYIQV
ncbi:hypothetical protein NE237_020035 [Protea cynaroides]|uniref:EamA domain-containing protein n=1 Tax=Protea cynaroides TaxID=273540 RepID=A0A9Q0K322_9MAGN|nr:hypothetical protein NE237_020035 [Protea cynaroides]